MIDAGLALRFHDPRRFGCLLWTDTDPYRHPLLAELGVEPLAPMFTGAYLYAATRSRSAAVKLCLMDHKLVEWVATLPSSLKVRGSTGKFLFKKSQEPRLPHDVLYRPKMGFAVPLARWFRGPLRQRVRDALEGSLIRDSGFFDGRALESMLTEHESGQRDHSGPLWSLLMFEAFLARQAGVREPRRALGLAA